MGMRDEARIIADKYRALADRLNEAMLRLWAAVEARALGRGGVSTVAQAIGMSRTRIYAGLAEVAQQSPAPAVSPAASRGSVGQRQRRVRVRAHGGGRKRLVDKDRTLLRDLDALVEPTARGDPMSPLAALDVQEPRRGWPRNWLAWAMPSARAACVIC
jgi:hypothetical protein